MAGVFEGDTEEDYGLIRPSLIKSLRSILDQYPDDGQILKELLQNAEDAGASRAQFLYDSHSYGTSTLHSANMAQFQGPGLYAFNDAKFDEKDWQGIRMLQDSIKEKDPMKVGRFGLGFKSVLHLTDMPSVISGDRVYMIDPHEKYFMFHEQKTTGKRWLLNSQQINMLPDQFDPYKDKFNCTDQTFSDGYYDGTMFRFPLRREKSALSDTLYDERRVTRLFNSFETDAHMVLLFLKNLESVELLVRSRNQKKPEVKFRVSISKNEESLAKRREFSKRMKEATAGSGNCLSVTYPLEIVTVTFEDGVEKSMKTYRWLVNEYYGGSQVSKTLRKLQSDPSLGYSPVVGTAMPLDQTFSSVVEEDTEELPRKRPKFNTDEADGNAIGQVFCFLPLPVEQKSSTGLPVHINGYFSVSQNRRHLKWPTTSQDHRSDKSLLWNHCLMSELIPRSYCDLILKAVALNQSTSGVVLPSHIEHALPNILHVDEKWQIILESVFQELFEHEVFYSQVKGGRWFKPGECVFDCIKEEPPTKEVVLQVLLAAGVPVVSIPPYILMAMGAYFDDDMEEISPETVRNALHKDRSSYGDISEDKKLLLLKYILKDEDFGKLPGIELLPLATNEFVAFQSWSEPVFISTPDCPAELLPGLEHMLLKPDLDVEVTKKFTILAKKELSQLRMLDAEIVASLVQNIIPKKSGLHGTLTMDESTQLTPGWLEALWNFLRRHYPGDLGLLLGLPILPLNRDLPITLVPIMLPSTVVCQSAMGIELPKSVCQLLTDIGVHVIEELPEYVHNHAAVIGNYVRLPLPADVIDSIKVVCEQSKTSVHDVFAAKLSPDKTKELVSFLSRVSSGELQPDLIGFLRQVPLFECTNEKKQFVSVEMVDRAAPGYNIPKVLEQDYLKLPSEDYMKVAKLLGVQIVTNTSLLSGTLLPKIKSRQYSNDDIQEIMEHVLADIHVHVKEDPQLYKKLSDIPFVTTESGNIDKPSALFDPEIEVLRDLFVYENRFPSQTYAERERLQLLRKMGLQTVQDVAVKDLLYCANYIDEACSDNDEASDNDVDLAVLEKKSMALVKFLSHKPEELNTDVNGQQLKQWLNEMCWVPVLMTKPMLYPQNMPWKGESLEKPFAKPNQLVGLPHASIVGSQKLVLSKGVSNAVEKAFAWNSEPDLEHVICHLQEVLLNYKPQEKAGYLSMITELYKHLQDIDDRELLQCLQDKQLVEWVWQGDGFTSVDKIFPKRQFIDLSPYVFSVPTEMREFLPLFSKCGMEEVCPGNTLVAILEEIKEKHDKTEGIQVDEIKRDLILVVDILNHMKTLPMDSDDVILIPVQTTDESKQLRLMPSSELTYCDTEWLRQGMDLLTFDEQDGIVFIHENIPVPTAEALNVPTLMSRMLHAEELEITGFGQAQPLTDRLRQLLEDYTDGLSIPKELIQNADDANATVVRFLYDERKNTDHQQFLIDVGMKGCQGPALWVYNDAVFTDADFKNIVKLGGATKEMQIDKIGKFGLGFNAVYNITDVPSFISRNNIVIFDPHTKHLGRGIRDRSKPGIKIDMQKNRTLMRKLTDQFKPYEDVFRCRVGAETDGHFDGTLFRLPLRTQQQAAHSQICNIHYDHQEVMKLIGMTLKQTHNLLLFTQNVVRVEFYHLRDGKDPAEAELLFKVEKEPVKIIRELKADPPQLPKNADITEGQLALIRSSNYLRAISQFTQASKQKSRNFQVPQIPQSSMAIKVVPHTTETGEKMLNVKHPFDTTYWLISACMGQEKALQFAQNHKPGEYLPVGGVAMALKEVEEGFLPKMDHRGLAFCFLPLPFPTEMMVHVNGSFAVQSSRKCLSEKTEDDKYNEKFLWNQLLIEDAVMHAYVQLLVDVKSLLPPNANVNLYETWPTHCAQYFRPLLCSFIRCVASLPTLDVMFRDGNPVELSRTVFLDPDFAGNDRVKAAALKVFSSVVGDQQMISIPENVLRRFHEAGCSDFVQEKILTVFQFYEKVYFPNIGKFDAETRDILIIFAIQRERRDLDPLLMRNACIAVSPDGMELRRPDELIYAYGMAAKLYTQEDGRFPVGMVAEGHMIGLLERLGMKVNEVDWEHLVERAESVPDFYIIDRNLGRERVQNIWNAIDHKVSSLPRQRGQAQISPQDMKIIHDERQHMASIFKSLPFLPTQKPPKVYPIAWCDFDAGSADNWRPRLLSSHDVFPFNMRYLVSATQNIMDDKSMTKAVKIFLGLDSKKAELPQVVAQAQSAMQVDPEKMNKGQYEELEHIFHNIYGFLGKACKEDQNLSSYLQEAFQNQECILIDRKLIEPRRVAFMKNVSCAPFLFSLPTELERKFEGFMKVVGVRPQFEVEDYMGALKTLHSEYEERKMNDDNVAKSVTLVRLLNDCMEKNQIGCNEVDEKYGPIYVPNDNGMLQPASTLCFNDCIWLTNTETMKFAHPKLALKEAAQLGVRTKKQEVLKKHTEGISFGQKHSLVDGIHQLLRNYPLDHEILKEMIQNADDAGASQIHFILDFNQHKGETVFDETWKPLQGPALLVYNDKPFTMNDLEAVQRFGHGSKAQDPTKTGQYGLGFSSIYHITDVPCILTSGPEVGKTLCVFDPLCSHVPDATPAEPGKRYTHIDELQKQFPDVFSCFHMDKLPVEDATLFRFPLRLSKTSKISSETIDPDRVRRMLLQLKEEIFDILLFTNNVVNIKLSTIRRGTGNLETLYEARSVIGQKDVQVRQEFIEAKVKAREVIRRPSFSLTDIAPVNVVFLKRVEDSENVSENWCISQNLGMAEETVVPELVEDAFKRGNMVLLPCGGVAYMLNQQKGKGALASPRTRKICCVLPLPVKTELNVHVNGHFALGSQNRRQLAAEEESQCLSSWNTLLLEKVVAPAFVKLLEKHRTTAFQQHPNVVDDISIIKMQKFMLQCCLNVFQNAFPNYIVKEPQLSILVKAVYTNIDTQDSPVMPCVKEIMSDMDEELPAEGVTQKKTWQITWLPPAGTGSKKAFFISKEQEARLEKPETGLTAASSVGSSLVKGIRSAWSSLLGGSKPEPTTDVPVKRTLKEVLLSCGFKMLDVRQTIIDNFVDSGVEIDFMSPEGVVKFFKTYTSDDPACEINTLPCPIEETPFKDVDTLVAMAAYCKEAATDDFVNHLQGLPLLLTNDGVLRVFDRDAPVFLSEHCDLLKSSSDRFVHKLQQRKVFKDTDLDEVHVFQMFTVEDLEVSIHKELPPQIFYDSEEMVEWDEGNRESPLTSEWLKLLWNFLANYTKEVQTTLLDVNEENDPLMKKAVQVQNDEIIKRELSHLEKWAIIPVMHRGSKLVASIQHAHRVIYFRNIEDRALTKLFEDLRLPQLCLIELSTTREIELAERLVTTPKNPASVLRLLFELVLEKKFDSHPDRVATQMLKYFCENIEHLTEDEGNVERLKALPFYETVYQDTIALTDCQVYTIPSGIPTDGIDVWQSKSGLVFLKCMEDLKPLYDFIGCANISEEEVYCQFIFQHLEYFTEGQRMIHLHHVYKKYFKDDFVANTVERQHVVDTLRQIPIIEDEDGQLQPASEFYDPENRLFEIMVPRAKFPPKVEHKCFRESEWYALLRKLGLIEEVTEEMFLEYTTAVALEGGRDPNSASAELKSKALCDHMFQMQHTGERDAIMKKISDVPFVAPAPIPFHLSAVCLQHGDYGQGLVPYMSFRDSVSSMFQRVCWSSANILPSWADPVMRRDVDGEGKAIFDSLGIAKRPKAEVVLSHIRHLCENPNVDDANVARSRLEVFQSIYKFLQEGLSVEEEGNSREFLKELSKLPCVVVEGGRLLVRPEQTVFNLYDEIRNYLYKVPLELGDVQTLFKTIGSTDRATGKQYASVLFKLHEENGKKFLNPNDMAVALKATKGYFDAIEEQSHSKGGITLFLPNENRVLQSSCHLVFNNSPYYYERVKGLRINFMVDLSQCGIRKKNVDEVVDMMPADQKPKLLSHLMKETLDAAMESCAVRDGTAAQLEARIKSTQFQAAVQRLMKHNMYKAGTKLAEEQMFETIDRLSNIKIFNVPQVKTHLFYETKEIKKSDLVKKCFASVKDNGLCEKLWDVYIEKDAALDQELLIPLVEVINDILSGMLHDSVLYLLPLLSCSEQDMSQRLDSLNIKVDVDTQASRQLTLLPQLGEEVNEEDARKLVGGHRQFDFDEYVGYQQSQEHPVLYCQVKEKFEQHEKIVYVVQDGSDSGHKALPEQLFKFVRK